MTTSITETENQYIETGGLHLASSNPTPEVEVEGSEPVSASVRMASYRLAAVFGELTWVNPDAA